MNYWIGNDTSGVGNYVCARRRSTASPATSTSGAGRGTHGRLVRRARRRHADEGALAEDALRRQGRGGVAAADGRVVVHVHRRHDRGAVPAAARGRRPPSSAETLPGGTKRDLRVDADRHHGRRPVASTSCRSSRRRARRSSSTSPTPSQTSGARARSAARGRWRTTRARRRTGRARHRPRTSVAAASRGCASSASPRRRRSSMHVLLDALSRGVNLRVYAGRAGAVRRTREPLLYTYTSSETLQLRADGLTSTGSTYDAPHQVLGRHDAVGGDVGVQSDDQAVEAQHLVRRRLPLWILDSTQSTLPGCSKAG